MNLPKETQSIKTGLSLERCQDDDKTGIVRVRSGMNTIAYWQGRLFRNSYRDRTGRTVTLPEWYCRFRFAGVTKRVRLQSADREKAAEDARELYGRLEKEGWAVVTNRQARLPASPTVKEFCELYVQCTASMERRPRQISVTNYCRCLRQLCVLAGVKKIRELTGTTIEKAREVYRATAREQDRSESGIQNTISKIIRNAGACFSVEARGIMKNIGFAVENPFAGIKRTQDIQPVSPLHQNIVEGIWNGVALLRDGDPDAPKPNLPGFRKRYRRKHSHKARWLPVDFREPHPEAYCAILLALGAGLRANEIDKARWSWLKFDGRGDCFLEIGEEVDFKPKGGTMRRIKIPREFHDALVATRQDMGSPYVTGGHAGAESREGYRRPGSFRAANLWLRAQGVEEGRTRGHPLHRLRKQFGS